MNQYRAFVAKTYPGLPADDGFFYNYYQGTRGPGRGPEQVQGRSRREVAGGNAAVDPCPVRALRQGGSVKLDANRQAIQDQWPVQIIEGADGGPAITLTGYVPNVNQSFGGLFKKTSPAPGRTQPPCVKKKPAVAGQDPRGQERRRHEDGHQVRQ